MKYVVIDMKMNPIADQYKTIYTSCEKEIIEIAAILLNENYQEIDSFHSFVRPEYNDGIETYMTEARAKKIMRAPLLADVLKAYTAWCKAVDDQIITYQWSDRNLKQLKKETAMKNIKVGRLTKRTFFTRWRNYQEEFRGYLGIGNELTLENAAELADLNTREKLDTPLSTARHMAKLMMMTKDPANDRCAVDLFIDDLLTTKTGAFLAKLVNYRHYVGRPVYAR